MKIKETIIRRMPCPECRGNLARPEKGERVLLNVITGNCKAVDDAAKLLGKEMIAGFSIYHCPDCGAYLLLDYISNANKERDAVFISAEEAGRLLRVW